MANDDPRCDICCDLKSEHVATEAGPFTCPRVARGEGIFRYHGRSYMGLSCRSCGGFCEGHDMYEFVPAQKLEYPYGHGWRPYDL